MNIGSQSWCDFAALSFKHAVSSGSNKVQLLYASETNHHPLIKYKIKFVVIH